MTRPRSVKVVPWAHGFTGLRFGHCWAIPPGKVAVPCGRPAPRIRYDAHGDFGLRLCWQHYAQVRRAGFWIIRPSLATLMMLVDQTQKETERASARHLR